MLGISTTTAIRAIIKTFVDEGWIDDCDPWGSHGIVTERLIPILAKYYQDRRIENVDARSGLSGNSSYSD